MSSEGPRVLVVGSRWLGAEVLRRIDALGCRAAALAPDHGDRLAAAAQELGLPWSAKPDRVALMASDLPWRPDLIVCAHSFRILPDWALTWPRLGAIGYHPSLLPAFKGRRAVEDAVAAGVRWTGGTVYRLTPQIDGGPAVEVDRNGALTPLLEAVEILPGETAPDLWRRALAPLGARLLEEAVAGGV
jgi:methionyl-tRNA formyltransferase